MSSFEQGEERRFRYGAVNRDGRRVRDVVRARDEPAALRGLMAAGFVVTELAEVAATTARGDDRDLRPAERVLIMRQLALMLEAGVTLLEALETVAADVAARRGQAQLMAVIASLKLGEALAASLRALAPGFPYYVYAMAEVGEAAGRVAEVLRAAGEQMAYEDRLRRDFVNALTYPALLACAGVTAVAVIFVEIVLALLGDDRGRQRPHAVALAGRVRGRRLRQQPIDPGGRRAGGPDRPGADGGGSAAGAGLVLRRRSHPADRGRAAGGLGDRHLGPADLVLARQRRQPAGGGGAVAARRAPEQLSHRPRGVRG